jgi:hypothetical protein
MELISMEIVNNKIIFKSDRDHYFKERDGLKCNTIRRFSSWQELKAMEEFTKSFKAGGPNKIIRIERWCKTEDDIDVFEYFDRIITDITPFEGWFDISWLDDRVKGVL